MLCVSENNDQVENFPEAYVVLFLRRLSESLDEQVDVERNVVSAKFDWDDAVDKKLDSTCSLSEGLDTIGSSRVEAGREDANNEEGITMAGTSSMM